jgi:hypothetical protein
VRITQTTRTGRGMAVFFVHSYGKPLARLRAVLIIRGQVPTASCRMRRENFLPQFEFKWRTQF